MKINKRYKTKIILIVITFIIAMISICVFTYKQNASLNNALIADKDISSDKETISNTNNEVKKKELKDKELSRINHKANTLLYSFNFEEANEYLGENRTRYELPKELKQKSNEIAIISNFEDMLNRKNKDLVIDAIKNFQNVDTFLVAIFTLESNDRRDFIRSVDSINPIFDGEIEIINKENITKNYKEIEEIKEIDDLGEVQRVYRNEFKIEGNLLWSYVVEIDNKLNLYKITQDKNNEMQYKTIEEWDSSFG